MEKILSRERLQEFLYKIRNTLCSYDYSVVGNVIFFNNDAVYEYLCEIKIEDEEMTVGAALEIIGPFIPISLTEDSFRFLIESAHSPERMEALEREFSDKNRMEFLQTLTKIASPVEWTNFLGLCEAIRELRERDQQMAMV